MKTLLVQEIKSNKTVETTAVNMDNITFITRSENNAVIYFVGGQSITVVESVYVLVETLETLEALNNQI